MSQYDQAQPQVSYPPPGQGGAYTAPAPPAGYPTADANYSQNPPPAEKTQSRGDGFWKGCCAALCCCCMLDACF
ncbi:hypothetical protein LguiA_034099 [Lonicera macranthoides]